VRNGAFFTVRLYGTGLRRILTPEHDTDVTASPDGTRIAYTSERPFGRSGVYVADADGSDETFLHAGGSPDWSPDGTQILLEDAGAPVVVDADGSDPTALPVPSGHEFSTNWTWHPDGARVSFSSAVGCGDVYTMNLDGTGVTRVTPDTCFPTAWRHDWLPSGAGIVFSGRSCDECLSGIFVMALPGGVPVALTDSSVFGDVHSDPQVSPDGASIVFVRPGHFLDEWAVWSMDVDGSDQRLLSDQADSAPAWLPEPP
jgi:Tol biopolymer transport system component